MEGPITGEMVGVVVAALAFAWAIFSYINRRLLALETESRARVLALETELDAKILKVQTDQTALHLQVTREYASVQHLEKVETRLVSAIDRLADEFSGLRKALLENRASKSE